MDRPREVVGSPLPAQMIEAKPSPTPGAGVQGVRTPVEVLAPDVLRTRRLVLRSLRASDEPAAVPLLDAVRATIPKSLNLHRAGESSKACFQRLLEASHAGDIKGDSWRRLALLHDGTPVGMVHIQGIKRGLSPEGDVGWWIGPAHRGQGLATEAVQAMTQHALSESPGLGLLALEAAITPDNTPSQRVAKHAGYTRQPGVLSSIRLGETWVQHEVWVAR